MLFLKESQHFYDTCSPVFGESRVLSYGILDSISYLRIIIVSTLDNLHTILYLTVTSFSELAQRPKPAKSVVIQGTLNATASMEYIPMAHNKKDRYRGHYPTLHHSSSC